jgi:hypothetical protein
MRFPYRSSGASSVSVAAMVMPRALTTPAVKPSSASLRPGVASTTPEPENTAAPQAAAAESLELVSAVAMPVLKRLGPVLGGLAFGLVLGLLLGHRRRIVIMAAAVPGSYPPARTVL